jgi:hypothetical protein
MNFLLPKHNARHTIKAEAQDRSPADNHCDPAPECHPLVHWLLLGKEKRGVFVMRRLAMVFLAVMINRKKNL